MNPLMPPPLVRLLSLLHPLLPRHGSNLPLHRRLPPHPHGLPHP